MMQHHDQAMPAREAGVQARCPGVLWHARGGTPGALSDARCDAHMDQLCDGHVIAADAVHYGAYALHLLHTSVEDLLQGQAQRLLRHFDTCANLALLRAHIAHRTSDSLAEQRQVHLLPKVVLGAACSLLLACMDWSAILRRRVTLMGAAGRLEGG